VSTSLVVDDEPRIRRALGALLGGAGHAVVPAADAAEGLRLAATRSPAAVLLDVRLPDDDGIAVCRRTREWSDVPVIMVSAIHDEEEKISALDAGADDYVTKPFSTTELLARLRAAIRRAAVADDGDPVVRFGDVEVRLAERVVRRAGRRVHLTAREYALLACLARHPGRVLTHALLLREVWGPACCGETHYVRVYMAALRKKLEDDPASPRFLLTDSGIGYRLQPEA
jgi:two-component system KDP operon response regulator KdpE